MKVIKDTDKLLTEEFLIGLVGKTVHATKNTLLDREGKEHNVWFAGVVAGYQKSHISYDFINDTMLDVAQVRYQILLTDGMAYSLSDTELEINLLTDDEFEAMLAEYAAAEAQSKLIIPEKKEKKIVLPGRDF